MPPILCNVEHCALYKKLKKNKKQSAVSIIVVSSDCQQIDSLLVSQWSSLRDGRGTVKRSHCYFCEAVAVLIV